MVDEEIKKEINNIKNNIELPADDSDKSLQEEQEDKWGRFLNNNTFLTIKNNFLSIKNIFSKFVTYIDNYFSKNDENIKNLKNNVNDKINELVGNINTKINDKVTEKLDLEIKNINKSIDEKTKDNVSQNDLNKELKDYAKLNEDNLFTRKITGKEIKSNSIETNSLKVEGKNVVTDTSNFAKLNTINDFTQKIKRSCDDLGICLLDHLIVGKSTYYSFREEREDFEL